MVAASPGKRWNAAVSSALALALVAALAVASSGGWWRGGAAITGSRIERSNPLRCKAWGATEPLGGGCLAKLTEGTPVVPCCGGERYACKPCPRPTLSALQCISPRHTLLLPAPGCTVTGGGSRRPSAANVAPVSAGSCGPLSAAAVSSGQWVAASSVSGSVPGAPPLLFQPGKQRRSRPPLGAIETVERLWGAGFDRVVVSGDSTVRHFYNRLVSVVRQQEAVVDGGGIAHAHYKLQAWQPAGAASSGNAGPAGSSWATDELWASPAANFNKGNWDEALMAAGTQHLITRSFPGAAAAAAAANASESGHESSRGGGQGAARRSSLTLDFVIGAKVAWQQPHMRQYLAADGGDGGAWRRRTLVLLSLCMWEQKHVFREGWLEFVEEVRAQVGQVVLLTCPVDRMRRPNHVEGRNITAQRNQLLREMVSDRLGGSAASGGEAPSQPGDGGGGGGGGSGSGDLGGGGGLTSRRRLSAVKGVDGSNGNSGAGRKGGAAPAPPPLMLLDVDGMTQRLPADSDLGVSPLDFHYQCMLASSTTYNDTAAPIRWSGGDGAPEPGYQTMRYDRVLMPPAGTCADPVNFAGWELLLSMLCPRP